MRAAGRNSSRWRLAALIYLCCTAYLLFQGGKTSFMLFMILNVIVLYLLLSRFSGIASVSGERRIASGAGMEKEQPLAAGTRLELELKLQMPGAWPIPYVLVMERLKREHGQTLSFEISYVPDFRRAGKVTYATPPLARGRYYFEPTVCATRDIFGLFEHTGSFEQKQAFSVLPQTVAIRSWQLLHRGIKGAFSHASSPRSAKETTQINGVREYLPGDRLSRIHWNATAKTGEWKSKEFEREAMPRSLVILDRYSEAYADEARFELAVSAAASLLSYSLKRDTAAGLLSFQEVFQPASAMEHRMRMLEHLVGVSCNAELPIHKQLKHGTEALAPGSIAVVITAHAGEPIVKAMQELDRRGLLPCLVHVQGEHKPMDEGWLRIIQARGWMVYPIRQLHELPALLEGGVRHAMV